MQENKKTLKLKHTSKFSIVNNLETLYQNQYKLRETKDFYIQVLVRCEKILRPKHNFTFVIQRNIAILKSSFKSKMRKSYQIYLKKNKI